jgi:hypothetical protein
VDIIFDKMEDESWQVRLKALYVVQALLEASGCDHYLEHLEENVELFQGLINDPKPSVASKALEVSKALGLADESEQVTSAKIVSRSGSSVATVDMLGFDSLSIQPTQSAQVQHQNTSYPSQRITIKEKNVRFYRHTIEFFFLMLRNISRIAIPSMFILNRGKSSRQKKNVRDP